MPYVKAQERWKLNRELNDLGNNIETPGDLDYCITRLCEIYLKNCGGLKFENLATIAGTILFVILENYRRLAAPYEDSKKEMNGDVYTNHHNIGE